MLTKEQSVANFKTNMDELIASNYILADKKLSVLLKGISQSKLFFELFKYCTDDFDYETAKHQAIVLPTASTAGRFSMPPESCSIIAFVFSLLYEIDSKELDLLKLLGACFQADGYNDSYKKFALSVLVPFRDEVIIAANAMISDKAAAPVASITRAEKQSLYETETQTIYKLMEDGKTKILQLKMEEAEKRELMFLYEGFSGALFGADAERVKLTFLGYKYAVLYHKKLDANISKIEKILLDNGVLN